MARPKDGAFIEGLVIDPQSGIPMHRQIYVNLREMILSGSLRGGARMPSSRALSQHLSVSRFTVVTALDQLTAEGYLRPIEGSGTYVETILNIGDHSGSQSAPPKDTWSGDAMLSKHARNLSWRDSRVSNKTSKYLHMSAPDHRLFPFQIWAKLTKDLFSKVDSHVMWYRDGDAPSLLEQQIASQIAVSRGIRCDPEEVVTTLGAHHAVNLLTELLLDPGDTVAFEEPGMQAIYSTFRSHGCNVLQMPVDENGANPSSLPGRRIKLAFVTAAKQQPLAITMPAKRKLEMLNWASENNAVIVEDDLGSEFRYEGRPIPPLKAMDRSDRVIYIGAFSMSLLQTLRVGYMIMPRQLAARCRRLIQVRYRATPQITEQILAHFIADGHYSRHLHKTRRIYARRQEHLLDILRRDFADRFEPPAFSAGFYNMCYFRDQTVDDDQIIARCNDRNLGVEQLSYYYRSGASPRKGMLVGFASSDEEEITKGCAILQRCLG
ncbi:PLP-dependent aminotransferase family protein [uncultured Roseovarius sp.]|uniref:MocR-like pyridoxine biosynthesis transcription factor PdxR n=1 Tax=uncultured Roseovarius sp. TaxID=293344 RepID=UPI002622290B|nr:PLP-dependent aminotransferase family protein [uncultured Roseovarius sp.]